MAAKTTHRSWSWSVRYSCECRDFIMKHRKEIIHVGVRHSCDSCDYNATELSNLKRHTESKHEGLYMTILHIQLFCVLQICPFDVSWCLHYLQWYFIPLWIVLLCRARSPFDVAYWWHCPQGIFIPLWTVLLCCASSPLVVTCCSHCSQNILYFFRNFFCADQRFHLLLLDTKVVYMHISYRYELLFCVLQDFLLMFLNADIPSCTALLYLASMSLWFFLMLTLPNMILYSFMDSSSVSCKISFWCCLLLALLTRNIYSLMNSSSVLCKISFMNFSFEQSRLPFIVAWYWHCPHGYFIPSWAVSMSWKISFWWTALLCFARLLFDAALS